MRRAWFPARVALNLKEFSQMTMCRAIFLVIALATFAVSQPSASAQSASGSSTPAQSQTPAPAQAAPPSSSSSTTVVLTYHRPTEKEKLKNYAFDSFGPYAILGCLAIA